VRHLQLLKDGFEVEGLTSEPSPGDSESAKHFSETLHTAPEDGEYTEVQLFSRDEKALYYKLLPNKSLDLEKVPSKWGMKTNKERPCCCVSVRLVVTS
jgi:hypothetical protein